MKISIKHICARKAAGTMILALTVVFLCCSTQFGTAAEPSTSQDETLAAPSAYVNLEVLLQAAKELYESGKYNDAGALLKEVLKKEPSNKKAAYYLDLVNEARLAQVDRIARWRDLHQIPNAHTDIRRQSLLTKLEHVRLAKVSYDLPLSGVLDRLRIETQKQDPEGVGINFMFYVQVRTSDGVTVPPVNMSQITVKIDPPLLDVRLVDVLEAITKGASSPIKYTIEDYAVVFSPKATEATLYTKVFKIKSNSFIQGLKSVGVAKTNETTPLAEMLIHYFTAAGANLSDPGKVLFFNDRLNELLVRASTHDLDIIEKALELLNEPPPLKPSTKP